MTPPVGAPVWISASPAAHTWAATAASVTRPLVIAHRGASADRPEHTREAYTLAAEQGADGWECDIQLTKDGQPVLFHDRTVDRTSTGRGPVSSLTLAELRSLDVGSWHPGATGPSTVLTLSEFLDLAAEHPGTQLFLETKHPVRRGGAVEHVLAEELRRRSLLHAKTAVNPVTVMSFSLTAVSRFRRLLPTVDAVLLREPRYRLIAAGARRVGADYLGPGHQLLDGRRGGGARVATWRDEGLNTYVWTVDDPALIRDYARRGVAAIATNRPAVAREALGLTT